VSLRYRFTRLLRTEGLPGLCRGLGRLLRKVRRAVLAVEEYYLHEIPLLAFGDQSVSLPDVDGFEVHVVESVGDANRLAALGYEDFRGLFPQADRRLAAGAVAFCAYVDRLVAHIGWVALTREAKRTFDDLPYRVDFDRGEGCSGGSWTCPLYRNRGLYSWVMGARLRYLRDRGCRICRNATLVKNTPSRRGQRHYQPEVVATARYVRIAGWVSWKELRVRGR
jgi:GNAT superfamily N-acetyltransferase